jgi:nicotinamide phosphoribosyltransferase
MSHYRQYPPGTEYVYSYFESRGGKFGETCFFGLQYFIKRYLEGVVVTQEKIDEAEPLVNAHMGGEHFNRAGWEHILHKCGGKLPISIKTVPEGTVVPVKNVLFTLVNTDPACFWLSNYLETLLVQVRSKDRIGYL